MSGRDDGATLFAPWSVDEDPRPGMEWNVHIYDARGDHAVCFMAHSGSRDADRARALLIAAAPDLLAALQMAVDQYGKPGGPWNVPNDPGGWLNEARAAIAKATGATS